MVIWLLAGGGESELGNREADIKGIIYFFEKHFSDFIFQRITPVRNKRLPPNVKPNPINALGKTGIAFAEQIKSKLEDAVKHRNPLCDVILILDDLDCCCQTDRKILFDNAINQAGHEFKDIKRIIGFASPELEAWIIADWDNTLAKHIDFRQNQQAMKHWLVNQGISFDTPEIFSYYDKDKNSCHDKLSECLIESSQQHINQTVYSKATHTPFLLYDTLKPDVVARKCPIFRDFFMQLQNLKNDTSADI